MGCELSIVKHEPIISVRENNQENVILEEFSYQYSVDSPVNKLIASSMDEPPELSSSPDRHTHNDSVVVVLPRPVL